jgi:hypothetical protein
MMAIILATAAAADAATKPAAQGDVTWFYSTLAQTAGALVGLLGAVLVSKIIDHNNVLRQSNEDVRRKINNLRLNIRGRVVNMQQLARDLRTSLDETRRTTPDNTAQIVNLEAYRECASTALIAYSPFEAWENHRVDVEAVTAIIERLTAAQTALVDPTFGPQFVRDMDADLVGLRELRNTLQALQRQLLPQSFTFIWNVLAALAATGIAWPLWELAFLTGHFSSMWAMLVCFLASLLAMLGYFWHQFQEMKALGQFEWRQTVT